MNRLMEGWTEVEFGRNEMITEAGQRERRIYFVTEGVQRSYYIRDGKEHVIAFTYPPGITGMPESLITGEPSPYYLQAVTPSKMYAISRERACRLIDEDREIERMFRKGTEQVLVGFIHRHYELLSHTIEERFKSFVARSPHLLQMVPHKHIASYLGIDATNFSKLMNSVKI